MIKVVEAPPGPPVMATLLAEVYGPDAATRRTVAERVKAIFHAVPFIVDIDDSYGHPRPGLRLVPDRERLEALKVSDHAVYNSIGAALGGEVVGYANRGQGRDPLEISVRLPQSARTWGEAWRPCRWPKRRVRTGDWCPSARWSPQPRSPARPTSIGAMAVTSTWCWASWRANTKRRSTACWRSTRRSARPTGATFPPDIRMNGQPADEARPTILWDGEWEITWVTFRDMGAAFGVAILGIYVLVVAQFKSFRLPLVILTPIPLTLVGIVIGHILFHAPFTATSMIGFIALAGIIVRNSILLVDFIRHKQGEGLPLREVLLEAGAIRFKPIVLTAAAAMIGASVILFDPIFQGLAISLLFGLASSTLLTVLVIPAIYVVLRDDGRTAAPPSPTKEMTHP